MIIDFHTHIFSPYIKENRQDFLKRDLCFNQMYSSPRARMVTAEDLVASMDQANIDRSVVLNAGWTNHELCVETNNYILESAARYPDRLTGFCSIYPGDIDKAVREIERCAKAGARGIGEIRPDSQQLEPDDKKVMGPLAETLRKYKQIFLCHSSEPVGHLYDGKGRVTPDLLYRLITNLPDVIIVCAHWGGGLPFYALMPEVRRVLKNTYFDTAASPFLYSPEIYRVVSQLVGEDRILLGTDYPLMEQARVINEVESTILEGQIKNKILGGNAARILGIETGETWQS